jgi:outer membrane lipoprotein carrier protein
MKKILTILFSFCTALTALAQREAIDEICQASVRISTVQADFTQTKKMKMLSDVMVSRGKMWCTQPNLLRWEYQSPQPSSFILNNGKVLLSKGERGRVISVNRSKMLRQITRLMIPNGLGKCLTDEKDFKVSVETRSNQHILSLLPQSKELKQLFARIILYYNRKQAVVTRVEMYEKNGDNSIIELTSIKTNAAISESTYSLNRK